MMYLSSYFLVQRGMFRRLVSTSCLCCHRPNYDVRIHSLAITMVNILVLSKDSRMGKAGARKYVIFLWGLKFLLFDLLDTLLLVKVIRRVRILVRELGLHRSIFRHDRVLSVATDRSRYLSMVYELNKINSTWIKSLISLLYPQSFYLVSICHAPRANHFR